MVGVSFLMPMRKTIPAALTVISLSLIGCAPSQQGASADMLQNPLYAEWYFNDIVENMMSLDIRQDPLTKTERSTIDTMRQDALAGAQAATAKRLQGFGGTLLPKAVETQGRVLLLDSTLFFSPDTNVVPAAELHVYLSTLVDPTETTGSGSTTLLFPEPSALDLGLMRVPYGASSITVPAQENAPQYRTVVLWDKRLKRMHAFAQLQAQQ
jgi:hypothetical protein